MLQCASMLSTLLRTTAPGWRPGFARTGLHTLPQCRVSIFNTFDTTTLLGSGGHIVYAGPTALTLP